MTDGGERPWWLRLRGVPPGMFRPKVLTQTRVRGIRLYWSLFTVGITLTALVTGNWFFFLLLAGPLMSLLGMTDKERSRILRRGT